jgi:hypothetical protein
MIQVQEIPDMIGPLAKVLFRIKTETLTTELLVYKTMDVLQRLLPMSQPMRKIEEGSHLIVLKGFIF